MPSRANLQNIVFVGLGTTTNDAETGEIWELAYCVRDFSANVETWAHFQIVHSGNGLDNISDARRIDRAERYRPKLALRAQTALLVLTDAVHKTGGRKPLFIADNATYIHSRVSRLMHRYGITEPWLYKPLDIESYVNGFLLGRGVFYGTSPGATVAFGDAITRPTVGSDLLGVPPEDFNRNTAIGQVAWSRARWDTMNQQSPYGYSGDAEWTPRYGGLLLGKAYDVNAPYRTTTEWTEAP